jgi:glycosyltransferase involved in cell wall biosynthesis
MRVLIRKVRSACYYAREWNRRRVARGVVQNRVFACRQWLNRVSEQRPEVLVGANFVPFGGTRQHMRSLLQYSSLNLAIVPDDTLLELVTPGFLASDFKQEFYDWSPSGVQAVHSHVFPWFIEWCDFQKREHGLRWVHTHHNWYYPEFGRGELEPWQVQFNEGFLFALRNADVCLSVSRWQQKFLMDQFGLKTHYLPNGVDCSVCDGASASRWIAKTRLQDFILYLGRNDPVKNPADFVLLARKLPAVQFVMIGQGLSPEVLLNEWQVTVPDNLTVLGGATHEEAQDAIAACSVLVMTSKREGLPTLALEAMAQQKPVVVPTEDGCMEAVGEGRFGFIYQQGNIDHLAEVTQQALQDKVRCIAARQHILKEYDWPVIMRKLDKIYLGALPGDL